MNSKIVEYKQRYFEVDDEVEDELIITQNRHNVVVDFLNNYPELWEIIYKFKSFMEDKDKKEHFIQSLRWEIGFINTLNVEKMISIWNYLAVFQTDMIRGKDWKYLTDDRNGDKQLTEFRFKLLLKILDRRFKIRFPNISFSELEDLPKYKNEKHYRSFLFKNTQRKQQNGFPWSCESFIKDIIKFINTHYSNNGINRYPQYNDLIYGNGDSGEKGLKGKLSSFIKYRYYEDIKPFEELNWNRPNVKEEIYHRLNGWGEYAFFEDYRIPINGN
jgi:hypothetical protein